MCVSGQVFFVFQPDIERNFYAQECWRRHHWDPDPNYCNTFIQEDLEHGDLVLFFVFPSLVDT